MLRIVYFWLSVLLLAVLEPVSAAEPHFADSPLRAVRFVDALEGWAVGDDGIILHSIDGGDTWERQPCGIRASLRSIHFLTPYTGWVVGRQELANGQSVGIVLKTSDGGIRWDLTATNAVPGLNAVKFFDERNGMAAGDGCDAFPSGLFSTKDGGRSWQAVAGPRCPSWLAADFTGPDVGVLSGASSHLAAVRQGRLIPADYEALAERNIHSIAVQGNFAAAAGQGGLVLISPNSGGMRWGFPELPLPQKVRELCDFRSVAVSGKSVWVAGRPGTIVLYSDNEGRSWKVQRTGTSATVLGMHFVDGKTGWAVGERGTVLLTKDAGLTWTLKRQSGQRNAALIVSPSAESVPLDLVALLGQERGYLAGILRVTCSDPGQMKLMPESQRREVLRRELKASRNLTNPELLAAAVSEEILRQKRSAAHAREVTEADRLSSAVRQVGGVDADSLWQFPLPESIRNLEPRELLERWDANHGGKSGDGLLRQLVLALRMRQPEVVIFASESAPAGVSTLVAEAMREACKLAADPKSFPEMLESLDLSVWATPKAFSLESGQDGTCEKVRMTDVLLRLEDAPSSYALPASRLLNETATLPPLRSFRSLSAASPSEAANGDVFSGTSLNPGGTARRKLPEIAAKAVEKQKEIELATQARRTLELLAKPGSSELASPERALAQIGQTVKGMPMDAGAMTVWNVANGYLAAGKWSLARETFLLMVDKYPGHPQSLEAYRWLLRFHSSSEQRRRVEMEQKFSEAEYALDIGAKKGNGNSLMPTPKKAALAPSGLTQTSFTEKGTQGLMVDRTTTKEWLETALAMESKFAAFGPMYARDPAAQLCYQSARRQSGDGETAAKWFQKYLTEPGSLRSLDDMPAGSDLWRDCIAAEVWLVRSRDPRNAPKPVAAARGTDTRPTLDGKLDDPCWQAAKEVPLTAQGDLPDGVKTTAKFARDAGHLYIAVECRHPEGWQKEAVKKRSRDADVDRFDRVDILLDLDRDYQTYYRFQVDQRGCLSEDCCGDKSWNPKWYVATDVTPTGWTAEIAIPLFELTGDPVSAGQAWAMNVVRVLPGRGIAAFSGPADAKPRPEGMGLLQFVP